MVPNSSRFLKHVHPWLLHRKLQTQIQVKKMRPINQSCFIFFSRLSGTCGIFTSTRDLCIPLWRPWDPQRAEILFYSTWRTQSLVHRRHLKMLQRRENKLRPHRRQTRGLEFRHHSHTGLPNSAFSAFSLLSRFEKAPERGYCCFFRLV